MNQNQWFGVGRVAGKPQLKSYTKKDGTTGFRCFFRLAVTRLMDRGAKRGEQRTSFIPIVAWGEQAKRHAEFLDIGTEVCVSGELVVDSHKQDDGSYKEFYNIQARDIQYGQRSFKNASAEQIQTRITGLQGRMNDLLAGNAGGSDAPAATPAATPAAMPTATPAPASNPFTEDGGAPAAPAS